jgi:hypothetical protein
MYQLYPKDLPVWFQEGTAQFYAYSGSDSFWKDARLKQIEKEAKNAPWMDLPQVEEAIQKKQVHPGLIYLGYLESEALILWIAKERGDSWVPMVMEKIRGGASFTNAFKAVVGVSPQESFASLRRQFS